MGVNQLSFEQCAKILNDIKNQCTGHDDLTPINNLGDFISVATTIKACGTEPIGNAISQVLSETVYSERPYTGKLRGLQSDALRWGGMVRKLTPIDLPMIDSEQFNLVDGTSIDPWIIRKHEVVQTNFYGADEYQYVETTPKTQMYSAFDSPEAFSGYLTMLATNRENSFIQAREAKSRAVMADLVTGRVAGADEGLAAESVIHLLSEYNAETGLSLDAQTVKQPENYPAFIKWVYGRIEQICELMTERSEMFQTQLTDKPINRHTDRAYQRLFIQDQALKMMTSRVLADTYHENMLTMSVTEGVNFWQSIKHPFDISATPAYMAADGTVVNATDPVNLTEVFGVIMDRDAAGLTLIDEESAFSPYNPRGRYVNFWHTGLWRWWTDFTEKSIVLLLD